VHTFVPGNELSLCGDCGRFVPGNESAWERNVHNPLTGHGTEILELCRPIVVIQLSQLEKTRAG